MKLFTFLGVGKYEQTTYTLGQLSHDCRFAPVASCHFLKPDSVTVFLTDEAREQIFAQLVSELPGDVQIIPVSVPLGGDEDELWQIFAQVSSRVQPGEELAFDITHGLRSFPLIGLLVSAFLMSGLNVHLKAVLYGAYDVGRVKSLGYTPMFDLSPMLSLLEWAAAADRFNRTGDSRYLASLVRQQRKSMAEAAGGDASMLEQVGHLGNLAGALTNISQSLHLIRPYHSMSSIAGLSERVQKARTALARSAPAQPFEMLLETILSSYQPLAKADPGNPREVNKTLLVERGLIGWYIERELWVQAVSLAREWLLSYVMLKNGSSNVTQLTARITTESVLGSVANDFIAAKKTSVDFTPAFLSGIPHLDEVLSLWPSLTQVRNDILHAGKRENPGEPQDLIDQVKNLYQRLLLLALEDE